MYRSTPQLTASTSHPDIRLLLGNDAPQSTFSDTWTWTTAVGLASLTVTICFTVYQVRKKNRAKEADRYQPDYHLLDETVVELEKLLSIAARKADTTRLCELLSRVKQAERRFPGLPFGAVVAHIDAYRKCALPDDFARKLTAKKVSADTLLDLSRQQGASIAGALVAIESVQGEIDRRTS
ncbi:hypothetical protein [Streptomyces sp. CRN 30]|uniref:hypothetical protein n=1 Tax=Streptomyces sp. CRN 30 TaxID=3075613 RepID=UPI002A813FC6|nr:hypothetical protein [Streptomyces sp. CRN 30]